MVIRRIIEGSTGQGDEAVELMNAGSAPISIGNWSLADSLRAVRFPSSATLAAGQRIWVAMPFSEGSVSLRCDGRRLQGRFEDEASLHDALVAAAWVALRWELVPSAGAGSPL